MWQLAGAGDTVPSSALRLGRETAPGREGQADASIRSDLNRGRQRWLHGVPKISWRVPIWRQPHPSRDQTLTAELGRHEGAVKITSPFAGAEFAPFRFC